MFQCKRLYMKALGDQDWRKAITLLERCSRQLTAPDMLDFLADSANPQLLRDINAFLAYNAKKQQEFITKVKK